ncbi:MAG: signal peptidase I [Patescibacteria group bacterium]
MSYKDSGVFGEELTPVQKVLQFIIDLLKVICISLAIIIPVRYFLIQPFYVKGASMEPTFYDHEYLIIDEISYRLKVPQRGDVVVFRYPKEPSQYFIKRVIGLPGETVEISDNRIFIIKDGQKTMIEENDYLSDEVKTYGNKTWTLGENEYYVMGDNREYSLDSRGFGPVNRELIVGRVWLRGWPVWRAGFFPKIEY